MLAFCVVWKEPLLRLFGASDQTIAMAMEYFTITLLLSGGFPVMNMMNAVICADGIEWHPYVIMQFLNINIILWTLMDIYLTCIFAKLGIAGGVIVIGLPSSDVFLSFVSIFLVSVLYFLEQKSFHLSAEGATLIPHFKIFSNLP